MTHWYLTLILGGSGWHWRVERGQEREVLSTGNGGGDIYRDRMVEFVFAEWSRLSKAG